MGRYYKKELASYGILLLMTMVAPLTYVVFESYGILLHKQLILIQAAATLSMALVFFKLFHFKLEKSEYKLTLLNILLIELLLVLTKQPLESLFSLVFVGLFEEVIYRDVYLKRLRERFSVIPAILINGLAFGFMHLPISIYEGLSVDGIILKIIGTTILGVLFCASYYLFKNITTLALLHTYSNLIGGIGQWIWLGLALCFLFKLSKGTNKVNVVNERINVQKVE